MKNLKYFISAIFFFALLIIAGCKKYPDGPLLSLRSKEHRVAGEWAVESFSINGYDSTSYLLAQPLSGFYDFSAKDHDGYRTFVYNAYNHLYSAEGRWDFTNDKKSIKIWMGPTGAPAQNFNLCLYNMTIETTWDIQRLTEKEMWLKGIYTDGREYYFKLSLTAE